MSCRWIGKVLPATGSSGGRSSSSAPGWMFRMPLFTVFFGGESTAGELFWVEVGPSNLQWNVLFQPGTDQVPLVAGLAFLHRQRWCYG